MSATEIAGRWIAEYGNTAAWYARRKIGELREWGDDEGAANWTSVLAIIVERAREC